MRRRRLWLFVALVAAQVILVAAFAAREEVYRRTGEEVLVRTIPVDPEDLLRGQYLTLVYRFQSLEGLPSENGAEEDSVYVELRREGRYWEPVAVRGELRSRSSVSDDSVLVRGKRAAFDRAEFPDLSRYYVRQGTPPPPKPPDVLLSVRGDGIARIVRLEIDGKRWP